MMNGLSNVLQNDCHISHPDNLQKHKFEAIWDTGATNCVISQNVVDSCNISPIGMTKAYGAYGEEIVEKYLVDIHLPNNVTCKNMLVTKGESFGADILIGMDVIVQGDFSVSNFNGRTMFSFRIPSLSHNDFVAIQKGKERNKIGRKNKNNRKR